MTAQQLNADISQRAVCDTGAMEWQQSPAPGCEVPEHTHPGGEELFVLKGGLEVRIRLPRLRQIRPPELVCVKSRNAALNH
jgi:quercetin dioxygenase-like cupin family protein